MLFKDRLSLGKNIVLHKGVVTNTPVGSKTYDAFVAGIEDAYKYKIGKIPPGAEHRPDLISNTFYNTPSYWWLLMLVNNISDPFEGFNVGDRILIPEIF
jgi:hypothetical protein